MSELATWPGADLPRLRAGVSPMSEWRGPYPFVDDAERELFSMSWSQWRDRAKAAEAEVERLTAERDALRAGGAVAQAAAGCIAELAAEVERLTEQLAEAEIRERKAVEAAHDLDRRIEKALTLLNHPTEVNGCNCLAHQIADILRGESDD